MKHLKPSQKTLVPVNATKPAPAAAIGVPASAPEVPATDTPPESPPVDAPPAPEVLPAVDAAEIAKKRGRPVGFRSRFEATAGAFLALFREPLFRNMPVKLSQEIEPAREKTPEEIVEIFTAQAAKGAAAIMEPGFLASLRKDHPAKTLDEVMPLEKIVEAHGEAFKMSISREDIDKLCAQIKATLVTKFLTVDTGGDVPEPVTEVMSTESVLG